MPHCSVEFRVSSMAASTNPFDDESLVLQAFAALGEFDSGSTRNHPFLNEATEQNASEEWWAVVSDKHLKAKQVKIEKADLTKQNGEQNEVAATSPSAKRRDSFEKRALSLSDDSFSSSWFSVPDTRSPSRSELRVQRESRNSIDCNESLFDSILNLDRLEPLYQCPICLDLLSGVIQETECCSQLFCDCCIKDALSVISDRSCPLCRGPAKLRRNEMVEQLLVEARARATAVSIQSAVPSYPKLDEISPKAVEALVSAPTTGASMVSHTKAISLNHPATNTWECSRCTLLNPVNLQVCEACNYPSPLPHPTRDPDIERSMATEAAMNQDSVSKRKPSQGSEARQPFKESTKVRVRCPYCNVLLKVPDVLRSPSEPFKCGGCFQKIALQSPPEAADSTTELVEQPRTFSGSILLKLSTGTLLRKDRWKKVSWRIDSNGLSFVDRHNNLLRRVHVHPFIAFTHIVEKSSSTEPAKRWFMAKMVENPRAVIAKSPTSVRQGAFTSKLAVSELCEVASDKDPSEVVKFVEATESMIKAKRCTMAAALT